MLFLSGLSFFESSILLSSLEVATDGSSKLGLLPVTLLVFFFSFFLMKSENESPSETVLLETGTAAAVALALRMYSVDVRIT